MREEQQNNWKWDFLGNPVVRTSPSNVGGVGSIPGQGAKIQHASWPKNQNTINRSNKKLNKDFLKMLYIKKIFKIQNNWNEKYTIKNQ